MADVDAGELLRLIVLGLRVKAERSGAVASVRLVDLLRQLHAADLRHASGGPAAVTSAIASGPPAPSTMEGGDWISVAQAAEVMGCSTAWVRWLIRSGRLTARRAGRRTLLVDRGSVDRYRHGLRPA